MYNEIAQTLLYFGQILASKAVITHKNDKYNGNLC